jgi:hypothetical protein
VFYFDYLKPIESKKVCVKSCPDRYISNIEDYKNYSSQMNVTLCFYNVTVGEYDETQCPPFPIFSSKALAHRCIPEPKKLIANSLNKLQKYSALMEKFKNITFFDFLNPSIVNLWMVQLHDDLHKIGLISGVALAVAFILVFLIRYIAKIMVIVILLTLSLGSIGNLNVYLTCLIGIIYLFLGLTTWLWYNYAEIIRSNSNNSTSFLAYSIISTVLTVIILKYLKMKIDNNYFNLDNTYIGYIYNEKKNRFSN